MTTECPWLYKGTQFDPDVEIDPKVLHGFVYIITNLETGKLYIGRKYFHTKKTKQVKGKKRKVLVESDWRTYWSSNIRIQKDVAENGSGGYSREILHLCSTRSECNYLETREIFVRDALLSDEYENDWVTCKITRKHLVKYRGKRDLLSAQSV